MGDIQPAEQGAQDGLQKGFRCSYTESYRCIKNIHPGLGGRGSPAQQEQSITIDDVVYALHGYEDVLEVREDKAYIYVEAKAPLIISQIQEIQAIVKEFNGDIDLSVKDHKVWKIPK